MNEEETKSEQTEYTQAQIEMLVSAYKDAINSLDKHLIYIASGTLVVSTSYLNSLIPLKSASCMILFYTGVTSLVISIIMFLISLFISAVAIGNLLGAKDLEQKIDHTGWINFVVLILTILGLLSITAFTLINIIKI